MEDICDRIPIIPQSQNTGTCWFNAILTCCLYSDGLSAIIFQKAIEDNWLESDSPIKIYMYNVLSYLYQIKYRINTDEELENLLDTLRFYLNKYKVEFLLLSYLNEYDKELFEEKKNIIFTGHNKYYIKIFLTKLGIILDNIILSNNYVPRDSNGVFLDSGIITEYPDIEHVISLLWINNNGYFYDGFNYECKKLIQITWRYKNKSIFRFIANFNKEKIFTIKDCKSVFLEKSQDYNGIYYTLHCDKNIYVYIKNNFYDSCKEQIDKEFKFRGLKLNELKMTELLRQNIDFTSIDDYEILKILKEIFEIELDELDETKIEELKELLKKTYQEKIINKGELKSIEADSKKELSIEQKDVSDLSVIPIDNKINMIRLTFTNLIGILERFKRVLDIIHENTFKLELMISGFRKELDKLDETKINEIYSKLKIAKQKFIKNFNKK